MATTSNGKIPSREFKVKVGLKALLKLKTSNAIAQEYDDHPVPVGQYIESRISLIFFSRSVLPNDLINSQFNTSSQAYEVNLLKSLASKVNVTVVYLGDEGCGGRYSMETTTSLYVDRSRINFLYFGKLLPSKLLMFSKNIFCLIRSKDSVLLTTAYYPLEMISLYAFKYFGIKVFSVVFDTHLQRSLILSVPKKWFVNLYFGLGFMVLKKLSGIIVLNDIFLKSRNIKMPFLKTKIGQLFNGGPNAIKPTRCSCTKIKFLFAGTFNDDNGVNIILQYLRNNKNSELEFIFYGYGDLLDEIRCMESMDSRALYGGCIDDATLDEEILKANYVVCLRNPFSKVCEYAFPSKLIKSMGSGVPVISNIFPGLDVPYHEYLVMLNDYSELALRNVISGILQGDDFSHKGVSARAFIEENNNWDTISREIVDFIFDNHCK